MIFIILEIFCYSKLLDIKIELEESIYNNKKIQYLKNKDKNRNFQNSNKFKIIDYFKFDEIEVFEQNKNQIIIQACISSEKKEEFLKGFKRKIFKFENLEMKEEENFLKIRFKIKKSE